MFSPAYPFQRGEKGYHIDAYVTSEKMVVEAPSLCILGSAIFPLRFKQVRAETSNPWSAEVTFDS